MSSMQEYYREYFKNGGSYTLGSSGMPSRALSIITWLSDLPKGSRVLDIGCGDMSFSKYMPSLEWVGMDICTDRAVGHAITHDLMKVPYPFGDASFDACVCSEVLEHVWDLRVVHKEAHRVLKIGGMYVISTPNFDWVEHHLAAFRQVMFNPENAWTMEHIRFYNRPIHEALLKAAGFHVADYTGADPHFGEFFQGARKHLKSLMLTLGHEQYKADAIVDMDLGRMFRDVSHTIAFLGRKAIGT